MADLADRLREALEGAEGWVVGGALRDELLGRPVVDVDVACREPERAARVFARAAGGAPFPLSERHGAWRIALTDDGTVDFTPLPGSIEDDLASRDFTLNAMARPVEGGELVDPFDGQGDIAERAIRAVSPGIFEVDPLRLLRAVRLEDELAFHCDPDTEKLVREQAPLVSQPAGERILGELERLSSGGYRRLDELGLLEALDGSARRFDRIDLSDSPEYRLVCAFEERVRAFPISRRLDRYARTLLAAAPPSDATPRSIHRFRRATEPWALDALAFVGHQELRPAVERARAADPAQPLIRGDELGLPPGPEIGRLLEVIAEERAAGTIHTKEEALELVRSHGTN
jgi:tRNA nucleotidyltransferase/poly(A) polymerase